MDLRACFVMLCDNTTQGECLELNLFGTISNMTARLRGIEPGTLGLLLNYEEGHLIGVFEATTAPGWRLEPAAWHNRFPLQFRVRPLADLEIVENAPDLFDRLGIPTYNVRNEPSWKSPSSVIQRGDSAEALLSQFRCIRNLRPTPTEEGASVLPIPEPIPPVVRSSDGRAVVFNVGALDAEIHREFRKYPPREVEGFSREDDEIEITEDFREALNLVSEKRPVIFITGKAGTGKSTLTRLIREASEGKVAVVAPTGIAALLARGESIHSFFRFPPATPNLEAIRRVEGREIYETLDTLIIDEISMVRPDLLDAIDRFLRLNGRDCEQPFGGVQVILVGDLFQLPPVVKPEEESLFTGEPYRSPFFFSAQCLRNVDMAAIDLSKVFRHSDPEFVDLLNAIRSGTDLEDTVDRFNSICRQNTEAGSTVTLCCRNDHAARINREEMDRLPGLAFEFPGHLTGQFDRDALPSPNPLRLKEGAKVMFTRNDPAKRWVNGTLGIVRLLDIGSIEVTIASERGHLNLPVESVTWDAVKYELNRATGRIEAKSKGTYTQFPLIPAWAITIHKCQGQTLDSAVIDLEGGAFAHGQAYVALSRCRTLEKMRLTLDLTVEDIRQDARVHHLYRLISVKGDES